MGRAKKKISMQIFTLRTQEILRSPLILVAFSLSHHINGGYSFLDALTEDNELAQISLEINENIQNSLDNTE